MKYRLFFFYITPKYNAQNKSGVAQEYMIREKLQQNLKMLTLFKLFYDEFL